ncbi:MAG TPA: pentapeptide repeat-containing protein [Ktedonobacteraceae bacterium]|nr:pentapeptide repeat-containing protein [Ktedonobacteraceae bacterium]
MIAEMLVVGGIVSVLIAIVLMTQLVTLKMQQQSLDNIHAQQYAWERAQEVRQQRGQAILESYTREAEKRLIAQVQQIYMQWQVWAMEDAARVQDLTQQYKSSAEKVRMAYELERIPHIEEAPLSGQQQSNGISWRPINLPGADLSKYDLSYRYLRQANLSNARLANTNLYMADLAGACLAGADLTGADLSAANLAGTDLRGANLTGANFLVADMQQTLLADAYLLAARNLTVDQVCGAIIDEHTQLDPEVDITRPRMPSIGKASVNDPHATTNVSTKEQAASQQNWQPANIETPLPPQPPVETPLPTEPSTPLPGMVTEISPACQPAPETASVTTFSSGADNYRPEQREGGLSVHPSGHSHIRANKGLSRGKYRDKKRAKAS